MSLIAANLGVAITAFILGVLVQDLKDMTKPEKRQGAVLILMILAVVVVSAIAH